MDPKSTDPNNTNSQPDLGSITPIQPQTPDISTTPPISPTPVDLPTTPLSLGSIPSTTPIATGVSSVSNPTQLPDLTPTSQAPVPESAPTTGDSPLDSTMSPPRNPLPPDQSTTLNQPISASTIQEQTTANLTPTPTFTPPPPPAEPEQVENSGNIADFGIPTNSFNWSANQNESNSTTSNDTFNFSNPSGSGPAEPAPSDLSHLVNTTGGINSTGQNPTTSLAQPETLIPGTDTENDIPNVPTEENHKSFPKWIIGVGIGLLLAVAGASAYFILGIGKTPAPGSIPAADNIQATIAPPVIQPTLVPTIAIPSATPSAGVSLPGGSGTQATSAADLLRQRQGR